MNIQFLVDEKTSQWTNEAEINARRAQTKQGDKMDELTRNDFIKANDTGKLDMFEESFDNMVEFSTRVTEQAATIARLTAAHEMQGESLVVLPRWMVSNMEDKLKAQAGEIERLTEKVRYAYVQIEALEAK